VTHPRSQEHPAGTSTTRTWILTEDTLTRIALLTTTETDLLSARASQADYVYGNPAKLDVNAVKKLIDGADLIVFRFLGGKEQLPETFTTCVESGLPLVVLGGQHTPDATLMELSTVPMGVAAQAHSYFVQGGLDNLRNVHAFLADTVLLTGDAFEPVSMMPVWSELPRPDAPTDEPAGHRRPRIGIIFYRAHYAAGNIAHIIALAGAHCFEGYVQSQRTVGKGNGVLRADKSSKFFFKFTTFRTCPVVDFVGQQDFGNGIGFFLSKAWPWGE